jgi:magnesium chelatase family protein
LFLDEFPEFHRDVLESLRQPLEDGIIHVARAARSVSYPAKFILIAAQNPCPCGWSSDPEKQCVCSPTQLLRYQKKISGPLLDRIDLHVEVPRLTFEKIEDERPAESSTAVQKRVEIARARQYERFGKANGEMALSEIKEFCRLDEGGVLLLKNALMTEHLSARAYHRVLKLGRTIADLAGSEKILTVHIAEALIYRPKRET